MGQAAWSTRTVPRLVALVPGEAAAMRRAQAPTGGAVIGNRSSKLGRGRRPPMSVLRTIEQKIEGLFEGVFGRAFRTHVQPVELARKLAKEMDDHRTVSVSRIYVPNEYTVFLSGAHPT